MTTRPNRGLQLWRGCGVGEIAVGCQPSEGRVVVTKQRDKTRGGGGGVDPITVDTIGNRVRI